MQDVPPAVSEDPPRKKSFWRSWKGGCLVALLSPVMALGLLVLFFMIPVWVNDGKLAGMISRFERYPLPPTTGWVGQGEGSVALRGNGNHCDYLARFTLETGLSVPELEDYYDRANIVGIDGDRPDITMRAQESSKPTAHGGQVVIVELFDSTEAGLDLRCH
ncbi:hypothetical protein ACIA8R_37120 [Nonomuraea sp. NPDC051191]|uniref:hypothetical protein n=1 Tax=Nonomuraea sp. NPDC051191 TaxID=3364372 RepID=UPI0037A0DAC9